MRITPLIGLALLVPTVAAADESLPEPPFPGDYAIWLHDLPQDVQLKINRFCTQHPVNDEYECGGIGPLHIPPPPHDACAQLMDESMPQPKNAPAARRSHRPYDRAEWKETLTLDQRHYVDQKCRLHRNAKSDLCRPQEMKCSTPLVLAFDDAPVRFESGARFAFAPGQPVASDWPTAETPWLALDRDGDGAITSGAELFGDHTPMAGGATASDGFTALATLDANHDGVIDRDDPAFASLVLWSSGGLVPLAQKVESISLAARRVARCDAHGNCEGLAADITWRDPSGVRRHGRVIDVFLPVH
jgi:hypothetical protein